MSLSLLFKLEWCSVIVLKTARDELSHVVILEKGTDIKCIIIHSFKGVFHKSRGSDFVSHSVIACASQLKYILKPWNQYLVACVPLWFICKGYYLSIYKQITGFQQAYQTCKTQKCHSWLLEMPFRKSNCTSQATLSAFLRLTLKRYSYLMKRDVSRGKAVHQ